jgi:hypothetical protein
MTAIIPPLDGIANLPVLVSDPPTETECAGLMAGRDLFAWRSLRSSVCGV